MNSCLCHLLFSTGCLRASDDFFPLSLSTEVTGIYSDWHILGTLKKLLKTESCLSYRSDKSGLTVVQEMIFRSGSSILHTTCAQDGHTSSRRDYRQRGQSFLIQSVTSTKHGNNLQSGQMPLENVIHCTAPDLYQIWVWRSSSQFETR